MRSLGSESLFARSVDLPVEKLRPNMVQASFSAHEQHLPLIQCDERRPICLKCEVHYSNPDECEYDNDTASAASISSLPLDSRLAQIAPARSSSQQEVEHRKGFENLEPSQWVLEATFLDGLDPFKSHPECRERDVDILIHHCSFVTRFLRDY